MLYNIDYLKLHLHVNTVIDNNGFTFKKQKYNSQHYANIYFVYLHDLKVAVLENCPHSSVLDHRSALLKIENRLLYDTYLFDYIDLIINALNAKITNISRLDIALDFINFHNNLSPKSLINKFLRGEYLRNGRGKFTVIGNQQNVAEVEYLRFGSKTSDINVYLYNKTKEMSDVAHKQYIADRHAQLNNKNNADVWRLEISLKSQALQYVSIESGEIFKINLNTLRHQASIVEIFNSLILKHFEFKYSGNDKNKSRLKNVKLFNFDTANYERIKTVAKKDVTKKDKVLLKSMYQFEKKYSYADTVTKSAAAKIVDKMKQDNYLELYLKRKQADWDNESFD